MTLTFDLEAIVNTEFGFAVDGREDRRLYGVKVAESVVPKLEEMARATWASLSEPAIPPSVYQPSEKHSGVEYLVTDTSGSHAARAKELHEATDLESSDELLQSLAKMSFYFARFQDSSGGKLTAIKRPTEFKGALKKHAVLGLFFGELTLVEAPVFPLDRDFDLLIADDEVHICRPRQFELACLLDAAILGAVDQNVIDVAEALPFVDCSSWATFAKKNKTAARTIASIREQRYMDGLDRDLVARFCSARGFTVDGESDQFVVPDACLMMFLEVLDRRHFEIELVRGSVEQYRTPSRHRLLQRSTPNGSATEQ